MCIQKINWNIEQLWNGCILAGLAHAIAVARYPFIANEQSWDGLNYSVQDSAGQRGTISFQDGYCVAAFRNDNSERIKERLTAENYFQGAAKEVIALAKTETLQYLLDEVDGEIRPFITTAFWGKNELYTNDTILNMLINGGDLLKSQIMYFKEAIGVWKKSYNMNEDQIQLLKTLYKHKVSNFNESFILSQDEIKLLCSDNKARLEESKISFEEMGIYWS